MLFIHIAFLLWSLCSNILLQNNLTTSTSSCWSVLVHFPRTSRYDFLSFCLTLYWYLLNLPSFTNIFNAFHQVVSSRYMVKLACCFVFVFSTQYVFARISLFSNSVCCRSFFYCPSTLISYQGFVSLIRSHR